MEKKKQLSEAEKKERRLNRQINFYIMRYMWQKIRKRSSYTIYDALNTSRERYTRIINEGIIRFKQNELQIWSNSTGLAQGIFSGEMFFDYTYKNPYTVTRNDWEMYFTYRGNGARNDDTIAAQEKIHKCLDALSRTDSKNHEFYALCYYLDNSRPLPLETSDDVIRKILLLLDDLTFETADTCSLERLTQIQRVLKEKQTLINAVFLYRRERAKSKK